ncbi:DUF3987 domain-containing protein [Kitasatospora sp. NPDC056800]|uniref:DUF3987 domain-containing protein n=1 Tax=Kitasatospora sp. NPDC056800 TaxID=3345948 RepID=UPI00368E60BC
MQLKAPTPDPKVYHGTLGRIVRLLEPSSEGDPIGILGSLMTGVSAFLGPRPRVWITDLEDHPVLIFCLLIGRSNTGKKGTATNSAKAALDILNAAWFKTNTIRDLTSGPGLIAEVRDATEEAEEGGELISAAPYIGHESRWVFSSEYGKVMANSAAIGSLAATIRQAWDGDDLSSKVKKDPLVATRPHIAILAHITPKEFRDRFSEGELGGGTYNRFQIFNVTQSKDLPRGGRGLLDREKLEREVGKLRENLLKARKDMIIYRTAEADDYWADVLYVKAGADIEDDSEMMEEFTARRRPYTLRLAALYALADGRKEIGVKDLEAANAICEYTLASIEYVVSTQGIGQQVSTSGNSKASLLGATLRTLGKVNQGLTLMQIRERLGPNTPSAEIKALLESLGASQKKGHKEGAGRPATIYYLPDAVNGDGAL